MLSRVCRALQSRWRPVGVFLGRRFSDAYRLLTERGLTDRNVRRVNLCCGRQRITGYFGVDILDGADLRWDLSRHDLPFAASSLDSIICMSAINYFTRSRAQQLVQEMHRVLKPDGVCRVGVQDMRSLAERYVRGDSDFFFQKLPDGRERFEGPTIGDKFAAWFYGYEVGSFRCEYFYDFESLAYLFKQSGFTVVERKAYRESRLAEVTEIDNRPEQMFYLEAIK